MTSCLTPLTGLTPEHIARGSSLEEVTLTLTLTPNLALTYPYP